MEPNPQTQTIHITCEDLYLCDIDGVLTDSLSEYQGADIEALDALLKVSAQGELGLATGRPLSWVETHILETGLISEDQKSRIVVASENGAVLSRYEAGQWSNHVNETVVVPTEIKQAFRVTAKQHEDCMEYDYEKVAMATLIELEGSVRAKERFQSIKDELSTDLRQQFSHVQHVRISNTAIAIDACHIEATKALAAKELLLRLGGGKRVHVFGDSSSDSDLAISAALALRMSAVTFNFVGNQKLDESAVAELQRCGVQIARSEADFSKGLIELLGEA